MGSNRGGTSEGPPETADYIKGRVHVTFAGLAIVLVLYDNSENLDATHAFLGLLVGLLGLTAATFAADVIAHLAVHHEFPDRAEFIEIVRVSLGALSLAVAPLALIAGAWLGVIAVAPALAISAFIYVAILGAVGWYSVRDAHLQFRQRMIALAMLLGLIVVVTLIEVIAHGH